MRNCRDRVEQKGRKIFKPIKILPPHESLLFVFALQLNKCLCFMLFTRLSSSPLTVFLYFSSSMYKFELFLFYFRKDHKFKSFATSFFQTLGCIYKKSITHAVHFTRMCLIITWQRCNFVLFLAEFL